MKKLAIFTLEWNRHLPDLRLCLALRFASEDLKKDREIVLEALKNSGLALELHASEDLTKDTKNLSSWPWRIPFSGWQKKAGSKW